MTAAVCAMRFASGGRASSRAETTAWTVPGTAPGGVKTISEVSQDNQIYALALEAAMVEQALPVGVTTSGGKTQIVINEKAAKGVGARFESSVLKLARVIQ